MAAAIGRLGHGVLTDVLGWLWVVLYTGIRRVLYQAIGNTLPMR
jgi:hypothetical protein